MSTAEQRKVALLRHTLLVRLGKEEIDRVVEIRTFVEVPFRGTGKEAQAAISELSLIVLLNEPVLLVYDAVIGQHLDCLMPGRVHCLVFCRSDGKEFGQLHTESHRDIGIFAHHAALLYGEQREL